MSDIINIAVVCLHPRDFQNFCEEMGLYHVSGFILNHSANTCLAGYVKYVMVSNAEQVRARSFASAISYGPSKDWSKRDDIIQLINQRIQCPK